MTQQGDSRFEHTVRRLSQQVADACRGLQGTQAPAIPNVPLPAQTANQLLQEQRRERRALRSDAQTVLDNGKDAYNLALQDPRLSQEVAPRVRVLTPQGMQRVLDTGMVPDAAIQSLSGGRLQSAQHAQHVLQAGGVPAQLLTRDFSNFMQSYSAARALQSPAAGAAIEQICTVVEPQHPPHTPSARQQDGFGQPPGRTPR